MTDKSLHTKERFDKIDVQLSGINAQLDKITAVVVKGFDRVNKDIETKSNTVDIQRIIGLLDALAKRQEISDDERLVMGHQLDRLNHWTQELAKKIGYNLSI